MDLSCENQFEVLRNCNVTFEVHALFCPINESERLLFDDIRLLNSKPMLQCLHDVGD